MRFDQALCGAVIARALIAGCGAKSLTHYCNRFAVYAAARRAGYAGSPQSGSRAAEGVKAVGNQLTLNTTP